MNPRRRRLAKHRRTAAKRAKQQVTAAAPTLTSFARMDRLLPALPAHHSPGLIAQILKDSR